MIQNMWPEMKICQKLLLIMTGLKNIFFWEMHLILTDCYNMIYLSKANMDPVEQTAEIRGISDKTNKAQKSL